MPIRNNTPLKTALRQFEGYRPAAYQDDGGVWTIGFGHASPNVHKGMVITLPQAEAFLDADINVALTACYASIPDFRLLDPVRQDALIHLTFNLGMRKLLTFHTFLSLVHEEMWDAAANDLLNTLWAKQVHEARANFVARQIRTGAAQ